MLNEKIVRLRKLKKDGSIDREHASFVAQSLLSGARAVLPIDSYYGYLSQYKVRTGHKAANGSKSEILINGFKMLDDIAELMKQEYDFLHRVWPDEVTVFLNGKSGSVLPVRFPRSRYALDIIDMVGGPVVFEPISGIKGNGVRFRNKLIEKYIKNNESVLIIDSLCRPHPPPAVIDISMGHLRIVEEGRVSSDEIKSLYFLNHENSA